MEIDLFLRSLFQNEALGHITVDMSSIDFLRHYVVAIPGKQRDFSFFIAPAQTLLHQILSLFFS